MRARRWCLSRVRSRCGAVRISEMVIGAPAADFGHVECSRCGTVRGF